MSEDISRDLRQIKDPKADEKTNQFLALQVNVWKKFFFIYYIDNLSLYICIYIILSVTYSYINKYCKISYVVGYLAIIVTVLFVIHSFCDCMVTMVLMLLFVMHFILTVC